MPIYEYKSIGKGCEYCRDRFEIRQSINAAPLTKCPECQALVRRLVSGFRARVTETTDAVVETESKIREHEKEGRWSHAAELADKAGLEDRARQDYRKAGYNWI